MVNKKFCIECGFELSTIAKFCEECGAKLIESKSSKLDIESETNADAEIEIEHLPQKIKSPNLTTEKNSQKNPNQRSFGAYFGAGFGILFMFVYLISGFGSFLSYTVFLLREYGFITMLLGIILIPFAPIGFIVLAIKDNYWLPIILLSPVIIFQVLRILGVLTVYSKNIISYIIIGISIITIVLLIYNGNITIDESISNENIKMITDASQNNSSITNVVLPPTNVYSQKRDPIDYMSSENLFAEGYKLDSEHNYDEAIKYFLKAAEKGDQWAQLWMGFYYQYGYGGLIPDKSFAMKWYELSANQENQEAHKLLSELKSETINQSSVTSSGKSSAPAKRKAIASSGTDSVTPSQTNTLNSMPVNELVTKAQALYGEKNYLEAFKYFKKAADQGVASAQYNLGWQYYNGQGVTQSDSEAVKWYKLAADQGNAGAQYNLGIMYRNGQGVTQSNSEAAKWFRLGADQGYAPSQHNLGWQYFNGWGVTKSNSEAAKWFRLGADQGYAPSQNILGQAYERGLGVTQSYPEARKWYTLAANQGNEDAKEGLERIKNK